MFTSRKHWNRNNSLRLAGLSSPQIFLDTFPPAQMFPCWRLFLLSLLGLWMGIFLCKVMIWSGMSPHLFRARPLEGLVFRMIGPYGHHHWVITTPDDHNGPEFMIWLANGFDETLVTKTIFHFLYSTTLFLFIQQYMLRKCIHTSIYIHIHPRNSSQISLLHGLPPHIGESNVLEEDFRLHLDWASLHRRPRSRPRSPRSARQGSFPVGSCDFLTFWKNIHDSSISSNISKSFFFSRKISFLWWFTLFFLSFHGVSIASSESFCVFLPKKRDT